MGKDKSKWEISKWPMRSGILGLHLTLNPQEVPIEARLSQTAKNHGIRLTDKEFAALAKNRELGRMSIRRILDASASGFSPSTRETLALKITDALLETSFENHMAREHPTWRERAAQLDAMLEQSAGGGGGGMTAPPVGFTLTIHFGKPPDPRKERYDPWKHGP